MSEKQKVLVVEDNPHTRFLVNAVLQAEGYSVIAAEDGRQAMEKLQDQNLMSEISLIFLDILMPHVNGLDILSAVKSTAQTSSIPVIMLTTRDMAEDFIVGYNKGADYYIPKPFTRQQLLYGINMVLYGEEEEEQAHT
ncbi:MAG: response regulator [Deltaproteobacteria bacterium]|nr:response regulator [Deltaproteobacteria bacterium]